MKKIILLIAISLSNLITAQNNSKSLLWKISGNGLSEPSYIYGTIHISCDATLPQKVKTALDKTNQLCLELDMDDPNMQTEMMSQVMMKDGITMKKLASEEDYKTVDAFITSNLGFSAEMINTVKPFMISAMLYPKMLDCEMQSVETELMKIASDQKEEVIGLETVTFQLDVFDQVPYQVQMNELIKTAKSDLKRDKAEINEMLSVYKSEDIEAIINFSKKSDNVITSKFGEIMLDNRNRNWIAKIEAIAKNKPTFFGVGAAHLGGEMGIINLLSKAGYKVEPIVK
ncbi:TraB/GumN family protein [Flavobacterium sp.]|jgi:uncharacterized protein YbaP (TraB family)|uniref:TraB/GumN family protein n=1 Tax=Flavobacterium sp. TaxID=239 RepID=UPI0037C06BC5